MEHQRAGKQDRGVRREDGILEHAPGGPAQVFLCDDKGRLLTRLHPDDPHQSFGPDLRVPASRASPEVAAALLHPGQGGPLEVAGVRWLVTFRPIPHSQDWLVGIVVPEAYYTRDLRELRDRFILMILSLTVLSLVTGVAALRTEPSLTRPVPMPVRSTIAPPVPTVSAPSTACTPPHP